MSIFASVKKLFQHSAVYGLGHIFNRAIIFFLLPLHTNRFPKADMGVSAVVFAYLGMLTIIYTYGLDTAFFRFYILADDDKGKNRIFTTAFLTIIATSLVFTALIFFNADWIADTIFSANVLELSIDLTLLVKMSAGILLFDALAFMPFLILRAEEKPAQFISFKFLNVLINFGFNIFFIIGLKTGIEGIFWANLLASAGVFVLLIPNAYKHLSLAYSRSTLKELFAFGIPYLPSTLSVALMDTADRIFLEKLAGVDAAGLYSQGAKLGMFMALFVTAFRFAWHPFFLATSKQENAKQVFRKIFTYVILACSGVFLFFSFFIDDIVRISIGDYSLLGPVYWDATVVVPVIFLAYIFYAAYLNFLIGIYLEKKTKYLPFITGAGMVGNIGTLLLLIPPLGIMGAAWARLVAYMIMAVALYVVGQKLYPVNYEWGRLVKLTVAVAGVFFLGTWNPVYSNILLKAMILLIFPILLFVIRFYDRSELSTVQSLLISALKRRRS